MYVEFVFIINFLLDFMILYGTKRVLKRNSSVIRIIFSSLFASTTTLFLYIKLTEVALNIVKAIYSILIILLAFGKNNFIRNITYFYLISIIIGGSIYLIGLTDNYYTNVVILILITPIIIKLFIHNYRKYNNTINDKYEVLIKIQNKKYKLEGYIDTGNQLEYNNKSVILVDLKIDVRKVIYVPYKTLNTSGIIKCIKPDEVIVNKEKIEQCLIGFANNRITISGCNCILPNSIKEIIWK